MKKIVFLLSSFLLATSAYAGDTDSAGPGNPASILCKDVGGTPVSYFTAHSDETGFCAVGGALIADWTLFDALRSNEKPLAVEAFLRHPEVSSSEPGEKNSRMSNPSSRYCIALGGTIETIYDSAKNQSGICKFSDNSKIEEWTLFYGPRAHIRLANILR